MQFCIGCLLKQTMRFVTVDKSLSQSHIQWRMQYDMNIHGLQGWSIYMYLEFLYEQEGYNKTAADLGR